MRAVFWPLGACTWGKRIVVPVQLDVDIGLINILIIEFLKINNELVIIMDIGILPRDQKAVLQPIALIHLEINIVLFIFMHFHGALLRCNVWTQWLHAFSGSGEEIRCSICDMRAMLAVLLFHFRFLPSLLLVPGSVIALSWILGFNWRRSQQVLNLSYLSFGILSVWINLINIFAAIDKSYPLEHLTRCSAPLQQSHSNLFVNTYGVLKLLIILGWRRTSMLKRLSIQTHFISMAPVLLVGRRWLIHVFRQSLRSLFYIPSVFVIVWRFGGV